MKSLRASLIDSSVRMSCLIDIALIALTCFSAEFHSLSVDRLRVNVNPAMKIVATAVSALNISMLDPILRSAKPIMSEAPFDVRTKVTAQKAVATSAPTAISWPRIFLTVPQYASEALDRRGRREFPRRWAGLEWRYRQGSLSQQQFQGQLSNSILLSFGVDPSLRSVRVFRKLSPIE
jgi:hypothetical protein